MKIKRIFLSFLMIMSIFCMVACKDKDDSTPPPSTEKQDSVVTASYDKTITRFAGDKLSTVELLLGTGSTDGTIAWVDGEQELELGTHSYSWNFIPTDSTKYNAKAGTIEIYARVPLVVPEVTNVEIVSGQTIYVDSLLSYVELGDFTSVIDGTIAWDNPNQVLAEGDNTCTWVFTPTDGDVYAKVKGNITVTATATQYLSSISVKSNTKASGYVAYDEFDCSGLTLNLNYNAGKVVPVKVSNSECSVIYTNGTSLKRGDTSVTIKFQSKYCNVNIQEVGYKIIEKPAFTDTVVYDGYASTLEVETSQYYSFEKLTGTNAGEYDLVLTIDDTDNVKWADSDTAETIVKCYIQEADHEIKSTVFTGVYDGEAHFSSASGVNASSIYYSQSELNEDNYLLASTEPIEFVNAGTHTVYYYAVGKVNYKDIAGSIIVNIEKQTPTISLEYLYTLKTNSAVNYPTEYVTVYNNKGEELPKGELQFTYYERYSPAATGELPNIKTQPIVSGSSTIGGAPVNNRESEYYVVVEYLGDNQNYASAQGYIEFYIDSEDTVFYANSSQNEFAFKEHETGDVVVGDHQITIVGTNTSECDAYLEFKKEAINSNGLIEVTFVSKFGTGNENVKTGKLIYSDSEYCLLFDEDGQKVSLTRSIDGETGEIITINVDFANANTRTLTKWEIPQYLNTFTAETVPEDSLNEEKNLGQNTQVTFYNDYGTIRFSANVNTICTSLFGNSVEGGYERWAGVVTVNVEYNDTYLCYTLTCSIITKDDSSKETDFLTSTGFSIAGKQLKFYWLVNTENPSSLDLHASSSRVQDDLYKCLIGEYKKV